MKLLVYGINHTPELTGIGRYTGDMVAWLAQHGHEVRVVTAPPYYPEWRVHDGHSAWRWRRESRDGAWVWRCPLWVPKRPGGLARLLHLASFALSSLPVMLWQVFWRPDVVWVVEPPLFCAPTAWLTARLCGARCWLHVQDFEVDAAFELGLLQGTHARRAVLAAERWLMRRFDRVSTLSGRMRERLHAKGVPAPRNVLFPNWVALTEPDAAQARAAQAIRQNLGIPAEAIVALYSGNMGAKQGLELLAEVARCCQSLGAHPSASVVWFVLCGEGVGKAALVRGCEGVPRVRFLDLQPAERLPALLAMADIHLLPQRADAADLVMPSKLTGMLASGRPVVATAAAGTEVAAALVDCGVCVPPGDALAFAEALWALAGDPARRQSLGQAGRARAVARMERSAVLTAFEEGLEAIVKGS